MKHLYIILIFCITNLYAYAQNTLHTKIKSKKTQTDTSFSAVPSKIKEIRAVHIDKTLNIDGIIDESEWALAAASPHFIQIDPEQGNPLYSIPR
jgi:DNA replicative helicase MCM subunit Mcm2 (Cdc46/Mcm family)